MQSPPSLVTVCYVTAAPLVFLCGGYYVPVGDQTPSLSSLLYTWSPSRRDWVCAPQWRVEDKALCGANEQTHLQFHVGRKTADKKDK